MLTPYPHPHTLGAPKKVSTVRADCLQPPQHIKYRHYRGSPQVNSSVHQPHHLSEKYLKMSHQQLYSEFMAVVQDEVSICAVPNKYGSQYQLIKDLIPHFKSTQQDRISNNQKKLVENRNQHHIFQ